MVSKGQEHGHPFHDSVLPSPKTKIAISPPTNSTTGVQGHRRAAALRVSRSGVRRPPKHRPKRPKAVDRAPPVGPEAAATPRERGPGAGGWEIAPGRLPTPRHAPGMHHGEYPSTATTSSDDYHAWSRSAGVLGSPWGRLIRDLASELRRIILPRTPVNKTKSARIVAGASQR